MTLMDVLAAESPTLDTGDELAHPLASAIAAPAATTAAERLSESLHKAESSSTRPGMNNPYH
jgi:hypothetical protein